MAIQYQGVWSLQSAAQLQSTQRWVTDPLYKNTTLLLQADDAANGAQNNTFLDSSSNAFAITRNGNTTQGSFTPFSSQSGAWSNYFDGSGDRLVLATNTALDLTDDFTIECWIYPTAISTFNIIFDTALNGTAGANMTELFLSSPNTLSYYARGSTLLSGTGITLNSWQHVALTKSGTTQRLFLNGMVIASTTSSTQPNTGYSWYIGDRIAGAPSSQYPFSGNISNFRVVKGVAVYTGNFTPPPLPLTTTQSAGVNIAAVTGTQTSLLTCQGNRFIDISSNTLPIIREGDTAAQPFSPFAPQYQWTSSVIGGSGYFDGTGDYLSAASNTALTFGTGDFTVEGWFYANALGGQPTILNNGSDAAGLVITTVSSKIYAYFVGAGNVFGSGGATIVTNTWYHFAWVRSGSTHTFYLNGAVYGATYSSAGNHASTGGVGIGYSVAGTVFAAWNGYIANVRMVKGTAVYTGAFTPPIAPVTTSGPASSYSSTTNVNTTFTSTNTSLLTNFTNAAIFDGTMKNNLETVGNAQISTAVVKYGSGSMYFDGTTNTYLAQNPATTDLYAFGSGDFTIECWLYLISTSSIRTVYDSRASGTASSATPTIYIDAGTIKYYVSGADRITGIALTTNQWYHVVVCRSGTSTRMFINGTQVGSTYSDSTVYINSARRPFIAGDSNSAGANLLGGYIDDLRITKGIARYTANFIPPSVALPRQ